MALSESLRPEKLSDLIQRDIEVPPCYIENGVLPVGGQLLFGGHAKVGKSFLMMELARALSSGESPFACPVFSVPRPVKVLIIEQELGLFSFRERASKIYTEDEIRRLGRLNANLWVISKVPELQLNEAKGRQLLYDIVEDVQPNVLILDPLGRFHSWDENSAQDMTKLFITLDELQKMFRNTGMALIASHHFGKIKDPRMGLETLDPYSFRGSSKFFDNPDTLVTVDRTHELKTDWEAWALTVRFTLRHAESPDDLILHVNERNDGRVRYHSHKGGNGAAGKKLIALLDKPKVVEMPRQLGFNPG